MTGQQGPTTTADSDRLDILLMIIEGLVFLVYSTLNVGTNVLLKAAAQLMGTMVHVL